MSPIANLPIRTKLALVMTAILAAVSAVTYVYVPDRLRDLALDGLTLKAAGLAEMSAAGSATAVQARDRVAAAEALMSVRRDPDLAYLVVVGSDGEPLALFNEVIASQAGYRTMPMKVIRSSPAPGRTMNANDATMGGYSADGKIYQTSAPIHYRGQIVGKAFIGVGTQAVQAQIASSRGVIALITVVAFGLGVLAVFGFSTVITGPLRRIVETAERIAAGDLSRRAEVTSRDEVGQLARSFNSMVEEVGTLNRTLEERVEERTRALVTSEERYRLLYERNLAGVYIADANGRIISCNEACARIFGYESVEDFTAGDAAIPYNDPEARHSILQRLHAEGVVMNEEVELRGRDNTPVWVLENVRLVPGAFPSESFLEGIVLDITDRKRTENEIAYRAYHDELTGLPNRALFIDRLQAALVSAERHESKVAVLFLDLDDLKGTNDTFGHATGDDLLKLVAERLSDAVRVADTVARIGGDEFLILLPDVSGEPQIEALAECVRECMAEAFPLQGDETFLTTSIGVAIYPSDGRTPDELIRCADGAMYRVKQAGGDGYQLSGRLGRVALGRMSMEQELRLAIDRDEFLTYYQPQVRMSDRQLCGAEALIRWQPPDSSIIGPVGFISLAEQTGLIGRIGEIVLRKACRQLVKWDESGLVLPHVSVNVSARQFYQRDFIGMVRSVIEETRIDPKRLELEITETVAMQKRDRSASVFHQLRDLGIAIAMDDFGTGQTSLSHLKLFPIDTVKIDKSFVGNIGKHPSDEWIVTAVLLLTTQLKLRTVAEGVESEEQWDFLAQHGCDDVQGYLISRPLTTEAFAEHFLTPKNTLIAASS
jgi:diguanylate cyclase (GGDEF)-like protein/PAS domain S-box-containing protein